MHYKLVFKKYFNAILKQILLVLFAFIIGGIILQISNFDPIYVLGALWRGIVVDFGGVLRWSTVMIFTGLAAAISFRSKIWNLGIDGQLYLGAFAAAWVGLEFTDLTNYIAIPFAMIFAIFVGSLWALIAGLLKVRFGTNEIVSTLMLNYIAFYITDWLVLGPYADKGISSNTFSTAKLSQNIFVDRIMQGSQANTGLYFSLFLALIMCFVMFYTTIGYENKIVGNNPWFAEYGGVKITKVILVTIMISGAIAGLAGAYEMMGVHRRFAGRFSLGLGFDGIVVAILAKNHPIGVIFSGLFFGALKNGAANMQRIADVPREMVEIIQSIIILFVSAKYLFKKFNKK